MLVISSAAKSQSSAPKREMRGVWIATIADLDWPSSNRISSGEQQAELKSMIDSLKLMGFNAIFFQVRSECDAMYKSKIEPWSYWLTGVQGEAPHPFFDPLETAIEEAHKNGMELHAWFNPFRAVNNLSKSYHEAFNHITKTHPDWIITYGNIKLLNPGLPQVRKYVVSVIMDVVRRYDIDGVHLDDYFYPYPNGRYRINDNGAFRKYPNGFSKTQKDDWRRNNINQFIEMLHDSISAVKPFLKFGVSPFGIWKSGEPEGVTGLSSYNQLYADALYWLSHKIIDYVAPQLYWSFGGKQDYGKLLNWWASNTDGRDLYSGQAAYKINNFGADEILNQIRADRKNEKVQGSIFFRARDGILDNPDGILDSLHSGLYRYPALIPVMSWKNMIQPNPPTSLTYLVSNDKGYVELNWKSPKKKDGEKYYRYAVYECKHYPISAKELDAKNLVDVVGDNKIILDNFSAAQYYYAVTALDRNWNESAMSNVVSVATPYYLSFERGNPFNIRYFQNYFNPFDSIMTVNYSVKKNVSTLVDVYNQFGKKIFSIGGVFASRKNSVDLNLNQLASGVYFIRIISASTTYYGKIFLSAKFISLSRK